MNENEALCSDQDRKDRESAHTKNEAKEAKSFSSLSKHLFDSSQLHTHMGHDDRAHHLSSSDDWFGCYLGLVVKKCMRNFIFLRFI